jgi:putative FmdB family regulatory protein
MPTYDYECRKCGNRFEIFQSMKDPKLTNCPADGCDGEVTRLLGMGSGILFKGSGFYQTDYRSSSYQAAAKAEAGSTKGEGSGQPANSEASAAPAKPSTPSASTSDS